MASETLAEVSQPEIPVIRRVIADIHRCVFPSMPASSRNRETIVMSMHMGMMGGDASVVLMMISTI